jgi:cation transport regulator ChaB
MVRQEVLGLPDSPAHWSVLGESLPQQAKDIFEEIYNSAREYYESEAARRDHASLEETASRVAWEAVRQLYTQSESTGDWQKIRLET